MADPPLMTFVIRCRHCDALVLRSEVCLQDVVPLEEHLRTAHPELMQTAARIATLLHHFTLDGIRPAAVSPAAGKAGGRRS